MHNAKVKVSMLTFFFILMIVLVSCTSNALPDTISAVVDVAQNTFDTNYAMHDDSPFVASASVFPAQVSSWAISRYIYDDENEHRAQENEYHAYSGLMVNGLPYISLGFGELLALVQRFNLHEPEEEYFIDTPIEPIQPAREFVYKIALTFDDGPSSHTLEILDILEEHNARATFFVLGNLVEPRADIVAQAFQRGNEIAGHSFTHRNFTRLNAAAILEEITSTSAAIEAATGKPSPPFFRPPYGAHNPTVRAVAREIGYSMVNWSIDPEDWRVRDAEKIFNHVMEYAVDGGIVVLHDIRPSTVEAVAYIVPALHERGFELVTVSELLDHLFGELVPGGLYTGIR